MSIKVEYISKVYGKQFALDNVSFEVQTGEIVGFLGPNGAGKSTMMKVLTCFIPPTTGKAFVNGFDVMEQSIDVRRSVGYLPENNPLYLDMYVKEYLEFIAGLHKMKNIKSHVNEMIAVTGLELEQHKQIGALSKGYRQRVGLAQALIHDPEVLILDEPTTGLDPNQLEEIRTLIKKVGQSKTVLLSTHIMQEVEILCSRVIIVNKGKIVTNKTTSTLQKGDDKRMLILVEFDRLADLKKIQEISGVESVKLLKENSYAIITKPDQDIRPSLFKFAVAHGLSIIEMQREEKKLEDVFKELTK
ncbi:MAG: gliding motility-associated ABC transporter ATP-binding subunit GldA [Bacteroidetes bacterium]|nr:gliding motility-associated ABC transporter ATP-binding subunit GldA [Bacteroidota bacterium]PHX82524.1 MAG: gliding motility-associated ABC transporter ATP-binding subunit GldA [Flavobacteriales bacterium]